MRDIKYIVVHCTATGQTATVDSIKRYWKDKLGWKSPGYHMIVLPDGTINVLAKDHVVTNGVKGFNSESLHISYIGGVDAKGKPVDNRTESQKESLLYMIKLWKKKYPKAIIQGHRDFPNTNKACPSFDARAEYAAL